MKIYNEIIIDMNPESSTFEKTIYEDSFEYNGSDLILAQADYSGDWVNTKYEDKDRIKIGPPGKEAWYIWNEAEGKYSSHSTVKDIDQDDIALYENIDMSELGMSGDEIQSFYESRDLPYIDPVTGDYGEPTLEASDFINEDGSPKEYDEVVALLEKKFVPPMEPADIKAKVAENFPKFMEASQEELGFLEEEREFKERELLLGKEKAEDVYGLGVGAAGRAKEAGIGKLQASAKTIGGAQYGGAGMRAKMGAQADIKKGFGTTQDVYGAEMERLSQEKEYAEDIYGLGVEKAEFEEGKGIYGLKKEAEENFESALTNFFVEEGFAEGGLVPSQNGESFLDFLTQLPDAGGN